jgi:capsular exopolysaccharide synthesis family protein
MAAAVANAITQNYINVNMERRFDANSYAKTFLEERIAQVKGRLEKAEKLMLEYARDNEIYNVGKEGGTTASQNVEDFNIALNAAQQERIKAESLYRQLITVHGGELPQVLESSIIKSLRENKVKLESEYQDKLNTFKPSYPAMQDLASRIEQVDAQLKKERQVVSNSIKATYEAAKAHEELIRERFSSSKKDMIDLQARGIEYSILKREADTNRELYDGLLQRLREVGIAGGVGTNNISIVDKAEIPKFPFKPNLGKNFLIAIIIGLLAGIGLAFLFEHLDDTFKRSIDVENELGLSVLGLIPAAPDLIASGGIVGVSVNNSRAAIVESYRSVRTALQFASEHGAPQLLAITSSEKGEAKTTSAVGVGIQFAQFGSKVLIIDCDLRNPSLHKAFGVDNHHGLTNVLAGGETPLNVTQKSSVANLYFMPSGPLPPNPSELLSSNKMKQLLELARSKFDYIIIDSPPILGLADVLVIANLVDAFVLQIHAGSTRRATVQAALKRLLAVRVKPLGCMLTRVRHGTQGYGYNYDYYYSYGDESTSKAVKASAKV